MPEDAWEKARCDEFADVAQDLRISKITKWAQLSIISFTIFNAKLYYYNTGVKPIILAKYYQDPVASAEKLEEMKDDLYNKEGFCLYLGNMEKMLESERKSGDFITGEKLRWADLFLANFTSTWEDILGQEILEKYPLLKKQQTAVHSHPKIKEWMANRKVSVIWNRVYSILLDIYGN